jgi:cystathionine gamma-synthase
MTHDRDSQLKPGTQLSQAFGAKDTATHGVIPPIHVATTYYRDADNAYHPEGYGYIRDDNPAFLPAEKLLARLENGSKAALFASGMAACTAPFLALSHGDHVVVPEIMYWGLRSWLDDFAKHWGLQITTVANGANAALEAALRPGETKIVWVETPANPVWTLTDIKAQADLAHRAGARLIVDNTVATPLITQPLNLGADLVVHSATKYLNGHSDVIAGAIVTAQEDAFWQRISQGRYEGGAVLGSYAAWLLLRGMRTLHLRVRESSSNAMALAQWLQNHPAVAEVWYPGLPSFPDHELAKRQMQGGFSGMLSFLVKGTAEEALRVATKTRLFINATSLGGVESLIEHRASVEGPDSPVPSNLLRLSVGIEALEDLQNDLDQALATLKERQT